MFIIIGGTSGIGLETANYFHDQKKEILIGGRNKPKDTQINYKYVDVTDEESIKNFFEGINQIKGLVYSAGITTLKKNIVDFEPSLWEEIIQVNVTGALLSLKHAYNKLVKAKGNVVILNSLATRTYSKFSGIEYTMSKSALSGLVKQLSVDFAKDDVLINSIFPSMTSSPMLLDNINQANLSDITKDIPLGRILKPIEVAKAIEYLISDSNTYMTGCGLDLNGGQYLDG